MNIKILKKISKNYKSPKYIYNLNEISNSLSDLRKSLPKFSKIYYSMKANPNTGIIKHLYKMLSRFTTF